MTASIGGGLASLGERLATAVTQQNRELDVFAHTINAGLYAGAAQGQAMEALGQLSSLARRGAAIPHADVAAASHGVNALRKTVTYAIVRSTSPGSELENGPVASVDWRVRAASSALTSADRNIGRHPADAAADIQVAQLHIEQVTSELPRYFTMTTAHLSEQQTSPGLRALAQQHTDQVVSRMNSFRPASIGTKEPIKDEPWTLTIPFGQLGAADKAVLDEISSKPKPVIPQLNELSLPMVFHAPPGAGKTSAQVTVSDPPEFRQTKEFTNLDLDLFTF